MLILSVRLSFLSWVQRDPYEHINIILVHAILFFSARAIFRYRRLKNLKNTIILWLKIYDNLLPYVRQMPSADFNSQILFSELGSKNLYKHINMILVDVILFFFNNHFHIHEAKRLENYYHIVIQNWW